MMSAVSLARLSRPLCCVRAPARSRWVTSRAYTGGQSTPSSLLTSALDQKQRTSHPSREDSVGPFQLGISQAALRRGEKAKKWSELSVGGKGKSSPLDVANINAGVRCS